MGLVKLAMEKEAGLWDGILKGGLAAGKTLMGNNTIRNAAIGTGVGAVTNAVNANPGERWSGALKGGLIGGALGGAATAGSNIYKSMKPGMGFGSALKQEGNAIKSSLLQAKWNGQNAYAVGSGKASSLLNRPPKSGPQFGPSPAPKAATPLNTPDTGFSKRHSDQLIPMRNRNDGMFQIPQGATTDTNFSKRHGATIKSSGRGVIQVPATPLNTPDTGFSKRHSDQLIPMRNRNDGMFTPRVPATTDTNFSKRHVELKPMPSTFKIPGQDYSLPPQPLPTYRSAYERGFGRAERNLSERDILSKFTVPSNDKRLLQIPSIMRQGGKTFTEANLLDMGIRG